jgi:hypothetical protein
MEALIQLVCTTHATPDDLGPLVTPVEGMWAYCEGRAQGGHAWRRIEPTRRELLGDVSQIQERRAS